MLRVNFLFPALLLFLLVAMVFAMMRQRKDAAAVRAMQDGLSAGQRVMTSSGLYGTVVDTTDTTVRLEVADGVVTEWVRMAIRELIIADEAALPEVNADSDHKS